MRPIEDRFKEKYVVDDATGCWTWVANRTRDGYGMLARRYPRGKVGAHRISWELHRGPIGPGECVLHKCDNPPCVNPDHLFIGTQADNAADRGAKNRTARGDRHGKRRAA